MSRIELFRAEGLPAFQNRMFSSREAALGCPTGDMVLVQDAETGLVFNSAFEPKLLEYDQDYQNEQACSKVFMEHLVQVERIVRRHFSGREIIEIGCGKGFFLEQLQASGFSITGIDPAYDGRNEKVLKTTFDPALGMAAEGIILRHVLEHVSDPVAFLSDIARANGGKGTIYIEVPCFEWICRHRAWFDVFYEHVNYFCLEDFHRMFGEIHDSGHLFGGQYLFVVAGLSSLRKPRMGGGAALSFPADFLASIQRALNLSEGKRSAVWGGASKGVIFTHYLRKYNKVMDFIIDINPEKQNKFIGVSGYKIVSPEKAIDELNAGDVVFIMNSNYSKEIQAACNKSFQFILVDQDA